MKTRESGSRMIELARSFPCMENRFQNAFANGLEPWDPRHIAQVAATWSFEEQLVVSFLLTVWDSEQTAFPPFNLPNALTHWDEKNWKAFSSWVNDPFTF